MCSTKLLSYILSETSLLDENSYVIDEIYCTEIVVFIVTWKKKL
jgi:hypothetical protein